MIYGTQMNEPIHIESHDSHNASAFIHIGLAMIALNFAVHFWVLSHLYIANMFIYTFGIAMLLLGYLKQSEPQCRLMIDTLGITFYHRSNKVTIPWSNIQRVGIPSQSRLEGGQAYAYIGFKIKDEELFYDTFPLRLASRLLIEQRPLWLSLAGQGCASGQCVPEDFIDSVEYKLPNNRIYSGLIGMFVHRSEKLNQLLGFHFFVETKGISISSGKLLSLLRDKQVENSAS